MWGLRDVSLSWHPHICDLRIFGAQCSCRSGENLGLLRRCLVVGVLGGGYLKIYPVQKTSLQICPWKTSGQNKAARKTILLRDLNMGETRVWRLDWNPNLQPWRIIDLDFFSWWFLLRIGLGCTMGLMKITIKLTSIWGRILLGHFFRSHLNP